MFLEDQAVAGRWRSLARAHLRYSTFEWTKQISVFISCVMNTAGWTCPTEGLKQFETRLGSIFKALQDLRKATGEDVTSSDLEVYTVRAGENFDHQYMEDAYSDGRLDNENGNGKGKGTQAPERVSTMGGLGLGRVFFMKAQDPCNPRGGGGEGGPERIMKLMELLSIPQVVLEGTISELLEPGAM